MTLMADTPHQAPSTSPDAEMQLHVDEACLSLGGRTVLDAVSLRLAPGEVVALLGPSGCGKTSLLRSIAGLQRLDGGRIHIAGRDVSDWPAQAREIGMMFQHYALFPNLSVQENIGFGLRARGAQPQAVAARTQALLAMVDLQALASRLPAALSGGQRQRVALARALAPQPRLLLMDEPFSALDEHFRLPLRRQFRQLQRALGQSCLIVTHDREEAFELADRVAVMLGGRIVQCASPRTLWREPANVAVADFLGVFNRLDARGLEGAWRRESGQWLAPIEAMQWLPAGIPWPEEALRLQARLQAVYWGQQRVAMELLLEGCERWCDAGVASASTATATATAASAAASQHPRPLTVWCDHHASLPEPGQVLRLAVPASALCWLPD